MDEVKKAFRLPLNQIVQDPMGKSTHGSFSSCYHVGVCVKFEEVI
jgi:hypothetical protein